ncbi:uncharacterized protein LOC108032863 isoform X2 [Drosophila biarmipes]|uniref:uncharacterized protein LOC108032863 isoform X2 n=1 Tax=Drosophila biarmipes TaxID=125945 RepID=UPI0021CCFC70|nr:uncharacterized protein LOC108032863 isoform X2 [Drosophila biarmipes]
MVRKANESANTVLSQTTADAHQVTNRTMGLKIGFILLFSVLGTTLAQEQPYYLQQCPRDEAQINECLRESGNKLVHYLQKGVPELDIYEIEPVMIDEIGIVLGSGPDGYRALFRNIQAYGVSNITVTNIRQEHSSLTFRNLERQLHQQ